MHTVRKRNVVFLHVRGPIPVKTRLTAWHHSAIGLDLQAAPSWTRDRLSNTGRSIAAGRSCDRIHAWRPMCDIWTGCQTHESPMVQADQVATFSTTISNKKLYLMHDPNLAIRAAVDQSQWPMSSLPRMYGCIDDIQYGGSACGMANTPVQRSWLPAPPRQPIAINMLTDRIIQQSYVDVQRRRKYQ